MHTAHCEWVSEWPLEASRKRGLRSAVVICVPVEGHSLTQGSLTSLGSLSCRSFFLFFLYVTIIDSIRCWSTPPCSASAQMKVISGSVTSIGFWKCPEPEFWVVWYSALKLVCGFWPSAFDVKRVWRGCVRFWDRFDSRIEDRDFGLFVLRNFERSRSTTLELGSTCGFLSRRWLQCLRKRWWERLFITSHMIFLFGKDAIMRDDVCRQVWWRIVLLISSLRTQIRILNFCYQNRLH